MKTLITNIKTKIQADIDYVRDSDVFVTEDADAIPQAVKFPAIGIKDGPVTRTELAGGMWEVTLEVKVIAWVQLSKPAAAVMGDGGNKGVLDMAADINASLDENLLAIAGMQSAFSPAETESELFGDEKEALQRKIITYRYMKEEDRP